MPTNAASICARPSFRGASSVLVLGLFLGAGLGHAKGGGPKPEDLLKGRMIISDRPLPSHWSSPAAYASQLRGLNKSSITYDKKTGKVQVYYAAFFAQPVNDVQVNFVIYDITSGRQKKGSWEAFLGNRGDRVIFNSVEFDKEDLPMNKKYLFAIESARKIIASGEVILRGEGPHYSGKVEFTDDEAKGK